MTKEEKDLAKSMVKTMRHDWRPNVRDAISPPMNIAFLLYRFDLSSSLEIQTFKNEIFRIMQNAEPYLKEVRKCRSNLKPKTRRKRDEALRNITTD